MGQFAGLDDVTARFEGVIPASRQAWVTTRIADAEARLVEMLPSLATETSPVRLAQAKQVICDAVLRLYRNPAGARNEAAQDYSVGRSDPAASGELVFTDAEIASLRIAVRRRGFGTIPITPFRPHQPSPADRLYW
ncbi:hypothetical protein D5S18_18620 [Nocardia panacis]|uniref:Head-to-tail adaptor n=1 Tax=Nocardia panacis TaxID=2340916 RepID=A0A3A4K656_9NOCA|nr:hypothetical protein [Nocardia panacis]RJO74168.1 hypothetical protein D5S18_18620 [Nocardia panacis]